MISRPVTFLYLVSLAVFVACSSDSGPTGPASLGDTIPNSAIGATGTTAGAGATETAGPSNATGSAATSDTTDTDGPDSIYNAGQNTVNWADVIEAGNLYDNVYAIYYGRNVGGTPKAFLVGTGFAAEFSNVLWTNAHVVYQLFDSPGEKAFDFEWAFAQRSGSEWSDRSSPAHIRLENVRFIVHPDFDKANAAESEDVAAFVFQDEPFRYEPLPSLLPERFVDDLRVGQPVGTLGYPVQLSRFTGSDKIMTPTFKQGTLSALRSLGTNSQNQRQLQYNLTTPSGTSGSPVFDHLGYIIGIDYAGTVSSVTDVDGNTVDVNIANANYAIRVDAMHELIPPVPDYNNPARVRRIAESFPYPYSTYQPFPD